MKKLLVMAVAALVATWGFAASDVANLDVGTSEVGLSGYVDFGTASGTATEINASYGYFIIDNVEVGANGGVQDVENTSRWRIGGFGEYNFFMDSPVVPYAGLSLAYASTDLEGVEDSDDAAEVGVYAGVKYFVIPDLSVFAQILGAWANEDVYRDDDKADDTDWRVTFGLRYYFDL